MSFLLDRMIKTKSKDAMHSSVYGQAQNAEAFGTSSVLSFEDRVKADRNRQTIRRYSDSQVVNEVGRKEKIADMVERGSDTQAGPDGSTNSSSNARFSRVGGSEVNGSGVRADYGPQYDHSGQSGANRGNAKPDSGVRNIPAGMRGASRGVSSTASRSMSGASSRPAPSRPPARRNPGIFR